jgi:hypothetical protein
MLKDFCIPLTMKIMGLGHSLYEAECLAAVIVIEWLVIYTIMGYRFPANEPERYSGIPSATGIHAGSRKSMSGESVNVLVDARRGTPALFGIRTPVPA